MKWSIEPSKREMRQGEDLAIAMYSFADDGITPINLKDIAKGVILLTNNFGAATAEVLEEAGGDDSVLIINYRRDSNMLYLNIPSEITKEFNIGALDVLLGIIGNDDSTSDVTFPFVNVVNILQSKMTNLL